MTRKWAWRNEQPANYRPANRPASIPRDELAVDRDYSRAWRPRTGPTRTTVQKVACPECGAAPGERCKGRRGDRKSNHAGRVAAWQLERNARRLDPTGQRFQQPRTAAETRRTEEESRGAVSLDADDAGATMPAVLGS